MKSEELCADLQLRLRLCGGQRVEDRGDAALRRRNFGLHGAGCRAGGHQRALLFGATVAYGGDGGSGGKWVRNGGKLEMMW